MSVSEPPGCEMTNSQPLRDQGVQSSSDHLFRLEGIDVKIHFNQARKAERLSTVTYTTISINVVGSKLKGIIKATASSST